jgi:glycosyltransferase involved in cell wall biosynthesis
MKHNVSIVIPTFNRAAYLIDCIESCLAQTVPCEVIVCDHGSTDQTPQVMKKYEGRVIYVRRELDSGVHFCWLDGILHASNDLIHLNFDDDWIEPTFIEKCSMLFSDDVGCVLSDAKIFFEDTKTWKYQTFKLQQTTGEYSTKNLLKFNLKSLTSPCAGIYRKQILMDNLFVGNVPFAKSHYRGVGPDLLFSLMSTLNYHKYGYVAEDLAVFRAHCNSITIDASKEVVKTQNIAKAYNDARVYYQLTKYLSKWPLQRILNVLNKFQHD